MAIYRQIHTTMWQDNWFSELDPPAKLVWVYLLTNIKTNQSGVYEYNERQAAFDTGLSRKEVADALQRFIEAGRVRYDQQTNEIMITNWMKYNSARSPKVAAVIDRELGSIKSHEFESEVIKAAQQYEYPIRAKLSDLDTVSIPYEYSSDTITQPEPSPEPSPADNQQQQANAPSAADAADPVPSLTFFQENLGVMAPIVQQQVEDWVKDFGNEMVMEAIKRAAESQKEWRYAQGILRQWDKKGLHTIEAVRADDVTHTRKSQYRGGKPARQEAKPDWLKPDYKPESKPVSAEEKASMQKRLDQLKAIQAEKGATADAN